MRSILPLLIVISYAALVHCDYPRDPYATLGLTKRASVKDIKRAYKSLAKEWHPDKNDSPGAEERFVAINKAYELLSDPLKKERYDKFGTFDDGPQQQNYHHGFGGFDQFFGGFGYEDNGVFAKQRISYREYMHSIQERSNQQPFILFAYSNYCGICYRLQSHWSSVTDDLQPLGYGIGAINAITDGNLLEKLRISRLPSIVAVVEGRVIHMRVDLQTITPRSVRLFARSVIPRSFLLQISSYDSLRRFIDQWKPTNKVSVLILGSLPEPRTRYLLAAMKHSHFARFGYVHLASGTPEVESMREALSIKCTQCENIVIFNDHPESGPVTRLSFSNANQLTMEAMNNLIEQHKVLTMPRLSSSEYLDELCPVSSRNPRQLCVILPVLDGASDENYIESWRQFAMKKADSLAKSKIRLVYLYANKQKDWLKPFIEKRNGHTEPDARDLLVIWRYEHVKSRFRWLTDSMAWAGNESSFEDVIAKLETMKLDDIGAIGNLVDEYTPSFWTKFCRGAVRMWEVVWFHMTKEEAYPILSVIGTLLFIVGASFFFSSRMQDPKGKKVRTGSMDENWHPEDPKMKTETTKPNPEAKIQRIRNIMKPLTHELRAESYCGLIRLLKPGCRSLVVIVNEESKERLLTQFAQYTYPLRNNKTFSFGFLVVEKNLPWFRKLLEFTLPGGEGPDERSALQESLVKINPSHTIGTVLAICGWKLYFSIYHPMHTTKKKKNFMGFDDSDDDLDSSSSDDADYERGTKEGQAMLRSAKIGLNVDNVLNGFPNWLDRLLEGSIRRYYIPEWPDNLR